MVDPVILPNPFEVGSALVRLLVSGELAWDALKTLTRLSWALVLAIAVGVPLGLILGYFREAYRAIEGILHALRSIPAAALFPLFLIVIGVGESSIVLLAFYNSATVILLSTVSGALVASEARIRQARLLEMNGLQIATRVLFWEALPHIFSGIRVALGYSLALVIAVEMFIGVSSSGLGRKIYDYQSAYRMPETYAAIILTSLLGIVLNWALSWIERRSLHWLPRGEVT